MYHASTRQSCAQWETVWYVVAVVIGLGFGPPSEGPAGVIVMDVATESW